MNGRRNLDRPIVVRMVVSLLLGLAAAGLFMLNRVSLTPPDHDSERAATGPTASRDAGERSPDSARPEIPAPLANLDRDVDSVLVRFGIETRWIRRREIVIPNARFPRVERRVLLPKDVATVSLNAAFNAMAKRYDGRAIASENLRENTVTVHIEVGGTIVQTIVLRPTAKLRRGGQRGSPAQV